MAVRPYEKLVSAFRPGDVLFGLSEQRAVALTFVDELYPQRDELSGRVNVHVQNTLSNVVVGAHRFENRYATDVEIEASLADPALGKAFREFLETHANYSLAAQARGFNWSRPSKGGIEFHIRHGRRVHFLVDGIFKRFADVKAKTGEVGDAVTSHELRWIYRHRDVDAVRAFVKFWTAGGQVDPRAVLDPRAWASYQPKAHYGPNWERTPLR